MDANTRESEEQSRLSSSFTDSIRVHWSSFAVEQRVARAKHFTHAA
jgi:hypothetical protein